MTPEPWIIDELEEEERRREEERRIPTSLELPLGVEIPSRPLRNHKDCTHRGVEILDISPRQANEIEI